jgi:hypothetical protein
MRASVVVKDNVRLETNDILSPGVPIDGIKRKMNRRCYESNTSINILYFP